MIIETRERVEVATELVVIAGGREIGTVRHSVSKATGSSWYHAALRLGGSLDMIECGLAQGFGDTPDAAVADAFVKGRAQAANYLAALADLEQLVMGSEVAA